MKYYQIIFTVIVLLISFQENFSQRSFSIQVKGEYNIFSLTDLKDFQSELLNSVRREIPRAESIESFPSYFGVQVRLSLPSIFSYSSNLKLGLLMDYSSTGGRIDYEDYSGSVTYDQLLKIYSPGLFIQKDIPINSLTSFVYGASLQAIVSDLIFTYSERIGLQNSKRKYNYTCYSAGLEPNFGLIVNKYDFSLGINISYLLVILPAHFNDTGSYKLQRFDEQVISLGLNGFRIGITTGYSF